AHCAGSGSNHFFRARRGDSARRYCSVGKRETRSRPEQLRASAKRRITIFQKRQNQVRKFAQERKISFLFLHDFQKRLIPTPLKSPKRVLEFKHSCNLCPASGTR